MSFQKLDLDERIFNTLEQIKINTPTAIQEAFIPVALSRQDAIGLAPTGTGKTFAFLIPVLQWVMHAHIKHSDPSVLILVPTRELVKQVELNINYFAKNIEIFYLGIYAGERPSKQRRKLNEIIDIVVATPGRLIQFEDEDFVSLSNIGILVVDEVDTLFDMGFQPDLDLIISKLPLKRQTLFLGANLPVQVEERIKHYMKNPKILDLGRSTSPKKISHFAYMAPDKEKFDFLMKILKTEDISCALIFTQSRENARITSRNLRREGLDIEEFHGGLTQRQRNTALNNFKSGYVHVLVCTDVAARGIDVLDISHVIQMDVPRKFDDYLHRAGRTGRMNKKGKSFLLCSEKENNNLQNIIQRLSDPLKILNKSNKSNPTGQIPKSNTLGKKTVSRRKYKR